MAPLSVVLVAGALTQSVQAKVGEGLAVTLAENGTTGYVWTMEPAQPPIVSSDAGVSQPGAAAPGAGGSKVFNLHVLAQGDTVLVFKLARPWETDAPIETARLHVTVR